MSIDLTEVRVLFLEESFDNIDIMESNLLDLEIDHIDKELVNSIFRAAHSIKGGAGIFNFENIIHFSHAAETLLDEMRNEEHLITQALIDLLLRSVDVLRMMLSAVQDNTDYDTQEAQNCLLELQKASQANQEQLAAEEELSSTPIPPTEGLQTSTEPLAPEKSSTSTIQKGWHILFKPNLSMLKTGNDPINLFRELNHLGELEVKVDTSQLPALAELDPQACYLSWELTLYGEIERAMLDELFEWVEDECELQITALEPDKSPLSCQSISEPHFSQNQEISLDTDESTKISRPERDKITDPKLDEHDQNLELVKSDEDEKALVTEEKSQPSPEKGLILEKDEMALEKGETESPLDKSETPLIHQDEIALKKRDEPISAVETEIAKISSKETAETKTDETKHTHSVALHLSEANSIRVGIDKVDALINMVGELVITQSMLDQIGENFENARINQLRDGLAQLERNTRELQESVMRIRMLPISFSFNRFPRLVHDLSTQLGKKVELKLSGEQTELDKTVLEKMNDPLVHLVRNALDHGIEMPEQRRTTGKSETGLLHLHAFHQSGNIMIKISDDGAGFDVDKIRSKALEKGLLNANERMTHEQVCEFIFHPGFSTAEQVSDLSGRGVGMDVVRRNIRALGGNIEVKSQQRVGSTFSIRLPLTLAILDGQLVRVGSEIYILPLLSIIESLRVNPKLVNFVAGLAEVYRLRDEYIPILRLFDLFGIATRTTELEQGLLVIVEGDGQKIGLFVDELLSQQQIVIKSLESNYQKVEGISGATILGDGSVALILDVAGLIHLFHSRTKIPLTRPLSVSGVRYEQ